MSLVDLAVRNQSYYARRSVRPVNKANLQKSKTCPCSPTTHPGSFRCSRHKDVRNIANGIGGRGDRQPPMECSSSRGLNFRRSAMSNSILKNCPDDRGVRRALPSYLIGPSLHQVRRRNAFEPSQSRLSIMSTADDTYENFVPSGG